MGNFLKNAFKSNAIALGVLLSGFSLFSLTSCGGRGTSGGDVDLSQVSETVAYEMASAEAPTGGYKIYLDASGSMPGYFTDGLTQYISLVSALQGANDNNRVHFWGDPNREVKDVNSDITRHNYKAKSSLFQDIFKTMAEDVANEDVLAFIITDGIVSNSSRVTNQRTGYTKSDLPLLPNKIKASLQNDTVDYGVALFRFNLPFNGKYWDIDNKAVDLKNVLRPLYVFAIGKPGAIVDFKENVMNKKEMENFKKMDPDALYLGMLEKVENEYQFNDVSGSGKGFSEPAEEMDEYIVVLPNGTEVFDVTTELPHWIAADGIKANKVGKLTVVSDEGTENKDIKAKVTGNKLSISADEEEGAEIDPGNYTMTYTIDYRPADAWKDYTCEDDRAIRTDETLVDKTFGLAELIKGFELATNHPDNIYKATFKFTKQ